MLGTLALVLIALTHGQKSSCGTLSSKDSLESWLIIAFHGVASGLSNLIEESFDVMVLNTSHHWSVNRLDRLDRLQGYKRFQRKFLDSRSEPQQNGRIQTRHKRTQIQMFSQIPRFPVPHCGEPASTARLGCLLSGSPL